MECKQTILQTGVLDIVGPAHAHAQSSGTACLPRPNHLGQQGKTREAPANAYGTTGEEGRRKFMLESLEPTPHPIPARLLGRGPWPNILGLVSD